MVGINGRGCDGGGEGWDGAVRGRGAKGETGLVTPDACLSSQPRCRSHLTGVSSPSSVPTTGTLSRSSTSAGPGNPRRSLRPALASTERLPRSPSPPGPSLAVDPLVTCFPVVGSKGGTIKTALPALPLAGLRHLLEPLRVLQDNSERQRRKDTEARDLFLVCHLRSPTHKVLVQNFPGGEPSVLSLGFFSMLSSALFLAPRCGSTSFTA